jgi:hypothetical protein
MRYANGTFYIASSTDALSATSSITRFTPSQGVFMIGNGGSINSTITDLGILSFGNNNSIGGTGGNPRMNAFGSNNTVTSADDATAIGNSNTINSIRSLTVGYSNTAGGSTQYVTAVGAVNNAGALGASAIGYQNSAVGQYSSAFGASTTASGIQSSVFGASSTATQLFASAIGYNIWSSAQGATAFGTNITNNTASSTMIGPSDSAKLTILNSGRAGLGTTTPAWLLQLASSTAPQLALTDPNGGTDAKHGVIRFVNGRFYIGTSSDALSSTSTAMTIATAGLSGYPAVGIGTTNPTAPLHVVTGFPNFNAATFEAANNGVGYTSATIYNSGTSNGAGSQLILSAGDGGGNARSFAAIGGIRLSSSDGAMTFATLNSATCCGTTEWMRLD